MSYHYRFSPKAAREYEESLNWYAHQNYSSAEKFIIEIENTLKLICDHPERWRNAKINFYELGVKRYPFSIIYTFDIDINEVSIISIYHQKRNPKNKYKET